MKLKMLIAEAISIEQNQMNILFAIILYHGILLTTVVY
jgi:hypothetical protein